MLFRKIIFFADITAFRLPNKIFLAVPHVLNLHLFWPFFIAIGGAQQPAALTQQTAGVMIPLSSHFKLTKSAIFHFSISLFRVIKKCC